MPSSSVVILVADGVRPDTLYAAMRAGHLPAMAAMCAEGAMHTVPTVFPSVTGVAYTPFLLGRYPGPLGQPGLRWFDRTRKSRTYFGLSRSYVGAEMPLVDEDLHPDAPTAFELAGDSLGALSVIRRGLPDRRRIGRGAGFVARAALTHFSGNLAGWLALDRGVAEHVARRVRTERPRFTFAAFTGVDKMSHGRGHESGEVLEALRIVDDCAAEIRADAERDGAWPSLHLWIVSDHGHSPVREHDDLAAWSRSLGLRVRAHPWVMKRSPDLAVMVSGNAMAHLYLELERCERPYWSELSPRWETFVDELVERPSVDLAIVTRSPTEFEVRQRGGRRAIVRREGDRFSYLPDSGDPLGAGTVEGASSEGALEATAQSDYPDGIVQIASLAGAPRAGEIILSARRGWDFRARYEPIPHVSSHGALHREHMLVPLLTNRPTTRTPRRTVDVMPSALSALGVQAPRGLDGRSFLF